MKVFIISITLLLLLFVGTNQLNAINVDASKASILRTSSHINFDGSYLYAYETENGIAAEETGIGGVSAQGRASWTAPDGTPVEFSYVADENGYRAEGPFVPKTPPHVLRLVEYLRTHASHSEPIYSRKAVVPQLKPILLNDEDHQRIYQI